MKQPAVGSTGLRNVRTWSIVVSWSKTLAMSSTTQRQPWAQPRMRLARGSGHHCPCHPRTVWLWELSSGHRRIDSTSATLRSDRRISLDSRNRRQGVGSTWRVGGVGSCFDHPDRDRSGSMQCIDLPSEAGDPMEVGLLATLPRTRKPRSTSLSTQSFSTARFLR